MRFFRFYLRLTIVAIAGIFATCFYFYSGLGEIFQQTSFKYFSYPLDIDMKSLVMNLTKDPGLKTVEPINTNSFQFIHYPNKLCSYRTDMLIMIKSSIQNYHLRQVLRSSWVSKLKDMQNISIVFLLAGTVNQTLQKEIVVENAKYGDIIQQNFIDSYFNNTYKTMMAFQVAGTNCSQAKFVLFVDDDYYIKFRLLNDLLQELNPTTSFMAGYIFSFSMPKRSPSSKWYISLKEYPYWFWPPFITGGAIIVSMPAVTQIMLALPYTKYLRFDDVFLGIIAFKLNIELKHVDYFRASRSIFYSWDNNIAYHANNNVENLIELWENHNY